MANKKEITPEAMLLRMAGLCAGAEQCTSDIRSKILKKGFSASQTDAMVDYLRANGYLDDTRYARAFTSDKVRFSGWGRFKIRMALRAKGIADNIITDACEHIDASDYSESLWKALSAKARSLDLSEVTGRQKLYRHMASRGFESSAVLPAIRRYMAEHKTNT